jgi:modulator of FtsH protease
MHEQWSAFFIAEVGAAAALAGMLFVALSINLAEIVKDATLPGRALETVTILTGALVTASLMLLPEQDVPFLGLELVVAALGVWLVVTKVEISRWRHVEDRYRATLPGQIALGQGATVPAIVAGALLIADQPAGYAVLAVGVLASFIVAIVNAWVLLVEILR